MAPLQPSTRGNTSSSSARETVLSARDSEIDPDDDASACRIGLILGLQSRADINGKLGNAVRWVERKKRWAVIVEGGEKILVKEDNIDFQAPAAIDAESKLQQALLQREKSLAAAELKEELQQQQQDGSGVPVVGVPIGAAGGDGLGGEAQQQQQQQQQGGPPHPLVQQTNPFVEALRCFCLPFGGAGGMAAAENAMPAGAAVRQIASAMATPLPGTA